MKFIQSHSDRWKPVVGEDGPMPHPDPAADRLLTLDQWHAVREHWPARFPVALSVPNDLDIESLADDLPRVALVALRFPKWTDGRAYTQARLLRTRLGFTGEVRATGEVLVDMVPLLARTGFDAAQLRGDQKIESAERALSFFNGHYQGDVQQPLPVFNRDVARDAGRPAADLHAGQGI
jgi:uncharacterized protein (DUF934 family)